MLKILFIVWSLERGGAERFLVSLLKSLDRAKIESVVCCLNWKGEWAGEVEEKGIKVIALNKKGKFDISAFIKLIKIIKDGKFDIVNTHLWGADTFGRIAAIFANTPMIITTAQNVDIWKKWHHRLIDRILSHKTNALIAVSEAVKDYYHKKVGIAKQKITVIPNAIEIERFKNMGNIDYLYKELNLNKDDFILSCIGRLTEQKGQRYLLEGINMLNGKYPNLKVLLIGEGEDKEKLSTAVKQNKLSDKIRFLGQRQDIPQLLHLSNAVVLPSLYEGLPVCILEAMAAGKPIIATDIGGTDTLVKNNETGITVPAKNPEALKTAIINLINLPDKGKKMGEEGEKIVKDNFSIKAIADKTTDLFLRLHK